MGRKYSDIEEFIEDSNLDFIKFLNRNLSNEVLTFVNELEQLTNVIIFSGVIRNFFLKKRVIRDLDLILVDRIAIEELIKSSMVINKNSYGGYKIKIGQINIDLWFLEDTWAFKYQKTFNFSELDKLVPSTAFFNFSAIIFKMREKVFHYSIDFVRFLRKKEIDVVYEPNMNYKLCVVNTYYYSKKYDLKISDKLKKFIRHIHLSGDGNYRQTQIKHFGRVLFSNIRINKLVLGNTSSLKKIDDNKKPKMIFKTPPSLFDDFDKS